MEEKIKIPEGVKAELKDEVLVVSGKIGEVKRKISHPEIELSVTGDEIIISYSGESRNVKKIVNTNVAHINNMFKGVTEGFSYKMKIVYTHFPITVKVKDDMVVIENFIGERAPRRAKIMSGSEVKIEKQIITISGTDIESVSQTAGNIERATRIIKKDRRVFQDGVYIIEKGK